MRDRLLGTYEVRPTLERLRNTLLGSALGLAVGVVAFWGSFAGRRRCTCAFILCMITGS